METAREEGFLVDMVVVSDDCALLDSELSIGARGIAGTVFVHKIAGEAAKSGLDFDEVINIARSVASDVKTMGVGLTACTIPAVGKPNFNLGENEVEFGLGIHGEPGIEKRELLTSDETVKLLVDKLNNYVNCENGVAVLVNNLGSTTSMELLVVIRSIVRLLGEYNVNIVRLYSGPIMTSLEMSGISISFLPTDETRLEYLDANTLVQSWPKNIGIANEYTVPTPQKPILEEEGSETDLYLTKETVAVIVQVCNMLKENEEIFTELDRKIGDGDLGINLEKGANAILEVKDSLLQKPVIGIFREIGKILQVAIGGSSGPLLAVLFLRMSSLLKDTSITPGNWAKAFEYGVNGISQLGNSEEGMRTMLDSLYPASRALNEGFEQGKGVKSVLLEASQAAQEGAERSSQIPALRGRSAYLGDRVIGTPDPGAVAMSYIFKEIYSSF
eukprot:TRINITY_DN6745_c0_g1_i2.p1 TRINITY_DN6745_c0_g1~~TRINITY_DN6745_c0_g1_i2.p1  ORF type:complete len:445 (-),score=107.21 TRINITY_DN6745_c0_g1_i2:57-1391(-)